MIFNMTGHLMRSLKTLSGNKDVRLRFERMCMHGFIEMRIG